MSSFNFNSLSKNQNMENILNNNDYKLIFLKAILLGINYGSSNNVNYYVQSIESEINNINILKSKNNDKESKNNDKELKKSNNDNVIEKHEKILLQLENTKNITLFNIQKFSNNHYASNYSRITFLQNNLNIINQEISKNKLIIKKYKDNLVNQTQQNNKSIKNKFNQNVNIDTEKYRNNNGSSLLFSGANIKENSSMYSKIKKNEYINDKQKTNSNQTLVGELEKTLDNLSNLFV